MKWTTTLLLAAALALPLAARAQQNDSKGRQDSANTMELRANEAFNRGQYSLAKELFTKVADRVKEDPKRLGQIQEQIRVCETNIKQLAAAAPVPQADQAAATAPQIETAAEKRKRHSVPKEGEVYNTSIKELGNFDYDADKGGNIPDDVRKLTGTKVRLRGFMIPLDQADAISHFSLVPSLFACCVGQPPQIQHQVVVHTPKG
ncbi:MAG TPA: DUF3299 domain-containing protein, partial [Tepidisphaeraceae bacterium]